MSAEETPPLLIGTMVSHVANPTHTGIISGLCIRANGATTYSVSWDDLADRWHYECELKKIASQEKPMGFK